MATYAELAAIQGNAEWGTLVNKVAVACMVKAQAVIVSSTPPATRLEWAKSAISDPKTAANGVVFYAVAANKDTTVSNILGASDGAVQTAINAAIDALYAS